MAIDTSMKVQPASWMTKQGTVDEFLNGMHLGLQAQQQQNNQMLAGQELALRREQLGLQAKAQETNAALAKLNMERAQQELDERKPSMAYITEMDKGNYDFEKPTNLSPRTAQTLDEYRTKRMLMDSVVQDKNHFLEEIARLGPSERSSVITALQNLNEWNPAKAGWVPSPEARQVLAAYSRANQRRVQEETAAQAKAMEKAKYEGRAEAWGGTEDKVIYDPTTKRPIAIETRNPSTGTPHRMAIKDYRLQQIREKRLILDSDRNDIKLELDNTTDSTRKNELISELGKIREARAKLNKQEEELDAEPTEKTADDWGKGESTEIPEGGSPMAPMPTTKMSPLLQEFQNWQNQNK